MTLAGRRMAKTVGFGASILSVSRMCRLADVSAR
jgi:hypothetical protein